MNECLSAFEALMSNVCLTCGNPKLLRTWRRLRSAGAAALLGLTISASVWAAEVVVLSAGAVEPGLRPALDDYARASGHAVTLSFATAPQLRQRIDAGERCDVLIAPPAVLDEIARSGRLAADPALRVSLGRVGIGVAVRPGAPRPDVASPAALRQSLLDAESLVFNRASTGLYLEGALARMGIAEQVAAKTVRYPDGASVLQHVLDGKGREIGFGALTEIALFRERGLVLVGPLPPELQNFTRYDAVLTSASPGEPTEALLRHLTSDAARARFAAAAIEPVR